MGLLEESSAADKKNPRAERKRRGKSTHYVGTFTRGKLSVNVDP